MASKVTPSIPGAPSLLLAISYAARIVSVSGPANQWTPLSSRPCLPLCWRHCKWQGPFAPQTLLRFIATTDPAATLSSSADFPVSPVIRPNLLRRFRAGTRRASPVARHVLVTVLSLPPRRDEQSCRSVFGCSCCLRPPDEGSALGLTHFRGHNAFIVVTAR